MESEYLGYLNSVLDSLETRQGVPFLGAGERCYKVTLHMSAYELYLLERMAGPVGLSREEFGSYLLGGALTQAETHSLGLSSADDLEGDSYTDYLEAARAIESKLTALRRSWRAMYSVSRPAFPSDGWLSTDSVEINVEAAVKDGIVEVAEEAKD